VVRLVDVHGVLTLLPGQAREYSRPEFARDLYLLGQSGVVEAGSTRRWLRWAASSGTRQPGVLTTVAVTGQQQRYWNEASDGASGKASDGAVEERRMSTVSAADAASVIPAECGPVACRTKGR